MKKSRPGENQNSSENVKVQNARFHGEMCLICGRFVYFLPFSSFGIFEHKQ